MDGGTHDSEPRAQGQFPLTVDSLAQQLEFCGMGPGQTVLVHMSMSKLKYVVGGAHAVMLALLQVLGDKGTLMMPTHTLNNTDPAGWRVSPMPSEWHQTIRDNTPAYSKETSPTRRMGRVAELFRTWPGVIRSSHPATSFAALGPNARYLVDAHPLEDATGEGSPLGRLYELDGQVLLLGVGHTNNTSIHLAEDRAKYPGKRRVAMGSAMLVDGRRRWVEYEILEEHSDDFSDLGSAFDGVNRTAVHRIAEAEVRFFSQRALVDFAVNWIQQHRDLQSETR